MKTVSITGVEEQIKLIVDELSKGIEVEVSDI